MKPLTPLSREQVRSVDRLAIERYGMIGLVLMENAGRGIADLLVSQGVSGPVVLCCGRGNNAGDGFVVARHLDYRGYEVRVLLWSDPDSLSEDARHNFDILQASGIPVELLGPSPRTGTQENSPRDGHQRLREAVAHADWIVDALLGTGAQGAPRPPLDEVIRTVNAADARRLAVDLPSGLDCDTGVPADPTFRADHTATFVAEKIGFQNPEAAKYLGQVHVMEIGVPRQVWERVG